MARLSFMQTLVSFHCSPIAPSSILGLENLWSMKQLYSHTPDTAMVPLRFTLVGMVPLRLRNGNISLVTRNKANLLILPPRQPMVHLRPLQQGLSTSMHMLLLMMPLEMCWGRLLLSQPLCPTLHLRRSAVQMNAR